MQLPALLAENRGRDICFVAAFGVVQAALMMATAFATRDVFSALAGNGDASWIAFAVLVGAPILLAASQAAARIRAEVIGQSYAIALRHVLFRAISLMSPEVREKRSLGGLSLRFVGDLSAARSWAGLGITRLISGIIVLPAAFACLWILNPSLAMAGVAPIMVSVILFVGVGLSLKSRHAKLRKGRAAVAILAMERIAVARDLTLLGRTSRELKQLDKRGKKAADYAVWRIRVTALLRAIPNASLGLGGVAILWTALSAGLPTGETAAALSVLAILTVPFRELVGVWDRLSAWKIARAKCEALLAVADDRTKVRRVGAPVSVRLRHAAIADEIVVPAGRVTRIAHADPDVCAQILGAISQRSAPVEVSHLDYGLEHLPKIALVCDRPVVLSGSFRRALTMGASVRPSDETIMKVAEKIGLEKIVTERGGLDAPIAEGAAGLAPVDVLRVSIAQAMLSRPDLIVINSTLWAQLPQSGELFKRLVRFGNATVVHALAIGCAQLTDLEILLADPSEVSPVEGTDAIKVAG